MQQQVPFNNWVHSRSRVKSQARQHHGRRCYALHLSSLRQAAR
jgi:hypothetical protein